MTDAERIAELEAEVAYLRAELGLSIGSTHIDRLRSRLQVTPNQARLLLILNAARGRVMACHQLLDAILGVESDTQPKVIDVMVCRIRAVCGHGVVRNVWGLGYAITPAGGEMVARAIEPEAFWNRPAEARDAA